MKNTLPGAATGGVRCPAASTGGNATALHCKNLASREGMRLGCLSARQPCRQEMGMPWPLGCAVQCRCCRRGCCTNAPVGGSSRACFRTRICVLCFALFLPLSTPPRVRLLRTPTRNPAGTGPTQRVELPLTSLTRGRGTYKIRDSARQQKMHVVWPLDCIDCFQQMQVLTPRSWFVPPQTSFLSKRLFCTASMVINLQRHSMHRYLQSRQVLAMDLRQAGQCRTAT
jgi:hypothetical protein